jgi:acetyl-CoA C-acetyltransferase
VAEAYVVAAVRTPIGTRKGALAQHHPADLAAHILRELIERAGVDPAVVDDVIMGCVNSVGPQAACIARTAWLSAGLPESVPGVTIDRQCGSSQQAVHFAAQAVLSGTQKLVVAAGVENMGLVPIDVNRSVIDTLGVGKYGRGWQERYGDQEITQFRGAQLIAEKSAPSRGDLELLALGSHERALVAQAEGRFAGQIAAVGDLAADEGPRADTTLEKMAALQPLRPGWRITAAVATIGWGGGAADRVA